MHIAIALYASAMIAANLLVAAFSAQVAAWALAAVFLACGGLYW